jgi:hypothetical protein
MKGRQSLPASDPHGALAFTRADFLASIAVVSVFGLLAAPAVANNRGSSLVGRCMSNMRHLALAWQLYAEDNNGRLVHNYHGGEAQGGVGAGNPKAAPWAQGWLDWTTSPDNTNVLLIRTTRFARIAPYIGAAENVHRCPTDQFVTPVQRSRGWQARVRTVSMNASLGEGNAESGPWTPLYAHRKTLSELLIPGPAETTVFIEEHPDSVNDPLFFPPANRQWIDWPAALHDGAAMFSFADEHVELHHWSTSLRASKVQFSPNAPSAGSGSDIHWMSFHTQRSSTNSF